MFNKHFIDELFTQWDKIFKEHVEELTRLDSVGGDGDLGIVMNDGFKTVKEFVHSSNETDLGKLFYQAGKCFNNAASSSMGTLIASGFMTIGKKLKGKTELMNEELIILAEGMAEGVQIIGKAKEGEKTFLDAVYPAVRAMQAESNQRPIEFLKAGVEAADQGVKDAASMEAHHGRLAFRKEASIGITDPGSVAAYLYIQGILKAVESE